MFAKVLSSAVVGLDGVIIEVETDILNGLPAFSLVGLADRAVEESKERVRSAIKNTGADLPAKRITINLAPGDLPKEGPSFDLPIALSILLASEQLRADVSNALFLGELSLDGTLRHAKGVLPMVLLAKDKGIATVFVPEANAQEAAIVEGVTVFAPSTLKEVFLHLSGQKLLEPIPSISYESFAHAAHYDFDMKDIRGQEFVKRALEIAVAGGHNIMLKGPPGAGKTLLAKTIPSILPPPSFAEALEVTKIYSIAGLLNGASIINTRPYRNPHHTTSHVGLIGGSATPKPGEVSLAHRGVLFLDEFPEFPRQVIEALRQPMEDGHVVISRARDRVTFPSRFMLIAAANPCPCGYYADKVRKCTCLSSQILKYQKRISGPIIDRIDMHVEVPAVKVEKLTRDDAAESSCVVRKRVQKAREKQLTRFTGRKIILNSEMSARDIKDLCRLEKGAKDILKQAILTFSLSARSYHKVIKISQTIADLEPSPAVTSAHILEALRYRPSVL